MMHLSRRLIVSSLLLVAIISGFSRRNDES